MGSRCVIVSRTGKDILKTIKLTQVSVLNQLVILLTAYYVNILGA